MNTETLRKVMIECHRDDDVGNAIRDLFALGCYLHAEGKTEIGRKAVDTALRAAKIDNPLFDRISTGLAGNEKEYLHASVPHAEMKRLLPIQ